jgi:hypothetical protein
MTYQERARFFPSFSYKPAPVAGNPEAIAVDPTWIQKNIVTVPLPQLVGVPGAPRDGRILMHRLAATPMRQLWEAWEQAGLLHLVLSFEGAWVPRFVRGSRTTLSNHALGTALRHQRKVERARRDACGSGDEGLGGGPSAARLRARVRLGRAFRRAGPTECILRWDDGRTWASLPPWPRPTADSRKTSSKRL